MGKLTRITWPQEYSELQRIEELLLCGICYDYMDTSVMTPCSHNYCSLCIRKYLHYKTQCPACFEKTFEKDLHTNRILDELVSYFSKIREKLVDCIAGAKIVSNNDNDNIESPNSTPIRPARTNQNLKKPSPKVEIEQQEKITQNNLGEQKVSAIPDDQKNISSPSTSGLSKVAGFFTPKSKKNFGNATPSGKSVPCPVCGVEVSKFHINKHLDDCLKRETVTLRPEKIEPKRKPLPKLVFSLMKDAELRKKMKDLGLPSQGDRKILEARFHRYSTLYNAECDKKNPRPIEELLKQCENEENSEKRMLKFAQAANRLKITRNCNQNIIEEAQKKYLETNRQNYQNLIDAIKERDKNRKPPVRRSLMDENVEASGNNVSECHDAENNTNNHSIESEDDLASYSMNAYEATFQDSDSSSPCPLQHYESNNPANFLSFTMTTSDKNITPPKTPLKSTIDGLSELKNNSLLEVPVSPVKSITLSDVKSDIASEEFSRRNNIYCATTDSETSDEEIVSPSPETIATMHTTKRPKLSLRQKIQQNTENSSKINYDNLEGQKLAMSIARDFTFDISSNDSTASEPTKESTDKITDEKLNVEGHEKERKDDDISNRDKENHDSATSISCPSVVNRPLRKRNSVVRSQDSDPADSAKSNEKTTMAISQEEIHNNEKSLLTSRADSPLKRRRRRKVTPIEAETVNPPRRPLRKRLVNSVSLENSHK